MYKIEFQIKFNMKKQILYLVFLLMVTGLQIDAQTIKNIHRHNLPVLRIPTALIDKVETAEINGQRTLRVIQFNGFVSQIPVAQIDSITHTEGTALDPAQLGNLRTASVMGVVRGPTGAPEMNAIVRSPFGGQETRTDLNGVFFLNNILVYDKLGYITITKPGFHQGSRSFLPLETGSNRVNVQLLPMTQSGTFTATAGGTITSGLLQLTFPANSIQLNGQLYTGTVKVFAAALDPTSTSMFDQMPGELLGGMNDSLRLLRSFGMASIELRDTNMNELQLANGQSSTLKFNIPTALQADAPATIDWWSFDETLGYWKHEGEAQKQGTQYIGAASHFSWWNCDFPQNFNDFEGSVVTSGGVPVSDAQINIISPTLGTGVTYTNAEGIFTCRVRKNQTLTLNVNLTCSTTNDWVLAHTETIISEEDSIVGLYTAELTGYYPITGTVVNCSGQPVESGYVKIGSQIFITENGEFTIQACTSGVYILRGYDTSYPDSIKASDIDTVQVGPSGAEAGEFQTCTQVYGYVIDEDGNIYPTILIGNQVWMAENLKTTHFANGSVIPNVTDNTAWTQFITPAWCSFNNSLSNDSLYGKLYNWYTTDDFRNVCPANWHVPTDADWDVLIGFIDEAYNPISNGAQSAIAGGKMKSISGWIPFTGVTSTNESGFSGLPGGYRSNSTGVFFSIGYYGNWWSSTEVNTGPSWYRYLAYGNSNYYRQSSLKKFGYSVRCIKD
jgi:uncharacterized protein (TIGR02145 family)